MKTYVARKEEVEKKWYLIDARDKVLGRLAARVAEMLTGKGKPIYTPFIDTGDYVIVINADKIKLTGRKLDKKVYRRHSGYPGGLKEITARQYLAKNPARMVREAILGMLPKTKLGRAMGKKLKVYAGSEHPHAAQKPTQIQI